MKLLKFIFILVCFPSTIYGQLLVDYDSLYKGNDSLYHLKKNDSLFTGRYIKYYDEKKSSKEEESSLKSGKFEGLYRTWYISGKLKQEAFFLDDSVESVNEFLENGNPSLIHKKINGTLRDTLFTYHTNGKIERRLIYLNGRQDGLEESWYDDGVKKYEKNWVNGNENGKILRFDYKGNLYLEQIYKNGVLISEESTENQETIYFTSNRITKAKKNKIIYVFHNEKNQWLFLSKQDLTKKFTPQLVTLEFITKKDNSINTLLDLQKGYYAYKDSATKIWVRKKGNLNELIK